MKISFAPSQFFPLLSLNSQLEGSVFRTLSKLPGASGCRDHIVVSLLVDFLFFCVKQN